MSQLADAKSASCPDDRDWIYAAEAARILGVHPLAVRKMVLTGLLATKKLPFTRVRVSLADVMKIASEAVRPTKST